MAQIGNPGLSILSRYVCHPRIYINRSFGLRCRLWGNLVCFIGILCTRIFLLMEMMKLFVQCLGWVLRFGVEIWVEICLGELNLVNEGCWCWIWVNLPHCCCFRVMLRVRWQYRKEIYGFCMYFYFIFEIILTSFTSICFHLPSMLPLIPHFFPSPSISISI